MKFGLLKWMSKEPRGTKWMGVGATNRPPFGFKHHPLEGDLVEGAGIYAFICLEVWKFLHQREGMAASSLEFFFE